MALLAGFLLGAGAVRHVCRQRAQVVDRIAPGNERAYQRIDRYLDAEIAAAAAARGTAAGRRDFSSLSNYLASVAPARRELARLLGVPPDCRKGPPPTLAGNELVHQDDQGEIRRWVLTTCDGRIPLEALVGLPKSAAPRPLVITFYGTGGSPERLFGLDGIADYHQRMAAALLAQGFVVFVPYIVTQEGTRPNWFRNRLDNRALSLGPRLLGIELAQCMHALDYLCQQPFVDPQNIAAYGISLGGFQAFHLAALDLRIGATVVSQYIEDRDGKLAGRDYPEAYWQYEYADYILFPGYLRHFADDDVAALIAPRKLFIETGRQDPRSPSAERLFGSIQGLYRQLGQPDGSVAMEIGAGGHEAFLDGSVKFLKQWMNSAPRKAE